MDDGVERKEGMSSMGQTNLRQTHLPVLIDEDDLLTVTTDLIDMTEVVVLHIGHMESDVLVFRA